MNKEKILKLLTDKGFYALLVLGVFVVAFAGFVNKRHTQWKEEKTAKYEAVAIPGADSDNTIDAPTADEKTKSAQNDAFFADEQTITPYEKEVYNTSTKEPEEIPKDIEVSSELSEADTSYVPALIIPSAGEIIAEFSTDELIYNKTMNDWRTHNGIDISGKRGAQVLAADDGTVIEISDTEENGYSITLEHKNGYITVYSNLQRGNVVKKGDFVYKGDVIGGIGETAEFESGMVPHVHFSLMKDNKYLNPLEYVN